MRFDVLCSPIETAPRPGRLPDGDRPFVHGGRPRDGRDGDGRVGERRGRGRAGVAARRADRCACAACTGTTGRSSGSAGARAPRSTWWAFTTPRSAAARSWPRPAISRRRAFSRSRWSARRRPFARSGIAGATSSTWGRPRSRPSCRCLETNETSPGQPQLAQLFVAEPVVAVHGQPFVLRDESPPATLGGGRVLQPSPRRLRRRDQASIDRLGRLRSRRPARSPARRPGVPRAHALDRAPTLRADGPGRRRDRTGAGGAVGLGCPGRSSGRAQANGPRAGRVRRRSRGPGLARPGPAARGPSPPFGDPPRPARGGLPRPGQRRPGGRPDRSAQGTGQGRRRCAHRGTSRLRAQAQPGRTETQGRAGRDDPLRRDESSRRGRAGRRRRPARPVVPDLLALLRDEQHVVEISSQLCTSTPTSRASCAAASANGSPTARRSRWPSSATCWARPGSTPSRSANTSTASA